MAAQVAEATAQQMRRELRRAALLTAGAGILFGILAIAALALLWDGRVGLKDGVDPQTYYNEGGLLGAELAAPYLLPFATIMFLWFIVALRGWSRAAQRRRNALISELQLVSGVVFIAVFLVGAGATASALVVAQTDGATLSAESLRTLAAFGNTLMIVMGIRVGAIFVIASASLGMFTGVLPRWFSFLSYGFGLILMLTPIVEPAFALAFPVWVITLGVMLLYHLANVAPDHVPGLAEGYAERLKAKEEAARERN